MTWRAIAGFWGELFLLAGMSGLWWLTGGVLLGAAIALGYVWLQSVGPVWLAPLIAIPAGPASAALANLCHRVARGQPVDSSYFWDGWRTYGRRALAVSAISAVVLSLLLVNLAFYNSRAGTWRLFSFLWLWLVLFWLSAQIYLFPALVGLEKPGVWAALRVSALLTIANPVFSLLLLALAAALTVIGVLIPLLIALAWPAVMLLLGAHSVVMLSQRSS